MDDDIPDQSEMDNALIEEDIVSSTFKLPASLRIIEEEAFEGTAVTQVDLPETLTTIEDRAFADAINLRLVNMPQDITVIGNDVFTGDNLVTITGTPDSYARTWAYLVTNVGNISNVILPKPQAVWESFIKLLTKGYGTNKDTLMTHMATSLQRLMIAFALSIVTAIPLGLLSGYFPHVIS